jgi:pheromone shutdown-related protein TraB
LNATDTGAAPDFLAGQPHAIVERDGVRYTLLGTAHVSKASVDAVEAALAAGHFDTIAVELDAVRLRALSDPDQLSRLDLFQIIRQGKTGLVAANLALSAYQRRIAEQYGIEPGAELKAAALGAQERGLRLGLIDRDVGTTLRRAWAALGFWGRSQLLAALVASLFADEEVDADEIEKLKQGDLLEASFGEFARRTPALYEALIAERDRYMAAALRQLRDEGAREVLAVVGAGHLAGLKSTLAATSEEPQSLRERLDRIPQGSRIPWFTLLLVAFLAGGFGYGVYHGGFELGGQLLLTWAAITALGGALGAIVAGGHPLSVLTGALASPLTPLHPALSSGMLSALVEAWVRKPRYQDFLHLRDDTNSAAGWWRNRISRTLLNFSLTSLGTAIAVWVAGFVLVSSV